MLDNSLQMISYIPGDFKCKTYEISELNHKVLPSQEVKSSHKSTPGCLSQTRRSLLLKVNFYAVSQAVGA